MASNRQPRTVITLPLVITTGTAPNQSQYVVDVDSTGNLIVQRSGETLFRIQVDGQVDAHSTFNDSGV